MTSPNKGGDGGITKDGLPCSKNLKKSNFSQAKDNYGVKYQLERTFLSWPQVSGPMSMAKLKVAKERSKVESFSILTLPGALNSKLSMLFRNSALLIFSAAYLIKH